MSCPSDSSTSEEEEEQHPEPQTTDTEPQWGEESEDGARQTDHEEEVEPNRRRHPQDWEAVMKGLEGLAYSDLRLDSDATVTGADSPQGPALSPHTPRRAAPGMPGSPMEQMLPLEATITCGDAMEVHVDEAELDNLWARGLWAGLAFPWRTYFARFVIKLIVEIMINKAVVGSGCGDMPKYAGEGVALCRTPSALGVLLPQCSCLSTAILGNFGVVVLRVRCV